MQQLFAGARACPTQAIIIEQYGRRVFPTILTPMFEVTRIGRLVSGIDAPAGRLVRAFFVLVLVGVPKRILAHALSRPARPA